MKKIVNKIPKVSLLLLFLISTPIYGTYLGEGTSGGGFQYRDTSIGYLKSRTKRLNFLLSAIPSVEFQSIVERYSTKKIDQREFRKIIKNTKMNPAQVEYRNNSDGYKTPLSMNYSKAKRMIVALSPFFQQFHTEAFSSIQKSKMDRQLIHEATHVFGIGEDDDDISYDLSIAIQRRAYQQINDEWGGHGCGTNGDLEQRVEGCNLTEEGSIPVIQIGGIPGANKDSRYVNTVTYKILNTSKELGFVTMVTISPYNDVYSKKAALHCKQMGPSWRVPNLDQGARISKTLPRVFKFNFVMKDTETSKRYYINEKGETKRTYDFYLGGPSYYDVVCISNLRAYLNSQE